MPKKRKTPAVPEDVINVSLWIPVTAHAKLKAMAAEQGVALSALVRESVAIHRKMPEMLAVARPGNFTASDKPRARD